MNYELTKQETSYYCIPAVLQAVLRRYGNEVSQTEIAQEINCGKGGAKFSEDLSPFFKRRNLKFEFVNYNETPFNEPDFLLSSALLRKKDVMLGYKNGAGLHIYLVANFYGSTVVLLDPNDCERREENLFDVVGKMFKEKTGGFGLVGKL